MAGSHLIPSELTAAELRRLHAARVGIRHLYRWSRREVRAFGLTPAQQELLLTIRVLDHADGPSIGDVATTLAISHHSAVELANHAELAGQVRRERDPHDARLVRLSITAQGEQALRSLNGHHHEELNRFAQLLQAVA